MTAKAALFLSRAGARPMPLMSPPSARTHPTWIKKCRPLRRGRRPTSTFAPTQGTAAIPPPPSAALIPLKVLLPSAARPRCLLPQSLLSKRLPRSADALPSQSRPSPPPRLRPDPSQSPALPRPRPSPQPSSSNVNAGRPLPRILARTTEIVVIAESNRNVPTPGAPSTTPTRLPQLPVVITSALRFTHLNPLATCTALPKKTPAQCVLIPPPRRTTRTSASPTTHTLVPLSSQPRHVPVVLLCLDPSATAVSLDPSTTGLRERLEDMQATRKIMARPSPSLRFTVKAIQARWAPHPDHMERHLYTTLSTATGWPRLTTACKGQA